VKVELGAFLRTTLPLDLSQVGDMDARAAAIWLPDHMVSFWPDSIWTPEFTDLATTSPSPHRHLDGLAVAAAVAVLTKRADIATCVVDTVRRHPSLLAQTALTIDHLSKGRFILGLGAGEIENCGPYGFEFHKVVSRFEEAIKVIKLLWSSQGPVDFAGEFFHLHHARLDTELYEGKPPRIWIGGSGPRMLEITGREADGWWPVGSNTPEDYAAKWTAVRASAERAGRDPASIMPALMSVALLGDAAEVAEMIKAPLVKCYLLQLSAETLRAHGHKHPMGETWRGIHDLDPATLSRERILDFLAKVDEAAILAVVPHGEPKDVARQFEPYIDAGARMFKLLDYGGMAGLKFAARSAQKVRETEDLFIQMMGKRA
jgi:phthiodiolone/phenolphthiodiolone dimycocerosates ketoreductase